MKIMFVNGSLIWYILVAKTGTISILQYL